MNQQQSIPHASQDKERSEQDGLRLHFTIRNHYLIVHALASSFSTTEQREGIVALRTVAREHSQRCYRLFADRLPMAFFLATGGSGEEVADALTHLEQTDAFRIVRQQTEEYRQAVSEQWGRTYPTAHHAMQEMTGLDFTKDITVLVTHPSLRNGQYLGNNTIAWGHHEEWEHYATVYLWHEVLHSYFVADDISHALIQLIADNELRVRLNPGITYPPFAGHESLFPLMARIEPYWRAYLVEARRQHKGDMRVLQAKIQHLPEMREQAGLLKEEKPKRLSDYASSTSG